MSRSDQFLRRHARLFAGLFIAGWTWFQAPAAEPVVPLPRAHAHNDYEHPRPLLDALDRGFCGVEADIHLVDGRLLVAHDRNQVADGNTLQKLYLDPLRERVQANGGVVHRGGPSLLLLIDIKSGAGETYAVLRETLLDYAPMLTRFENGVIHTNAVTVVISGNRPIETLASERIRYAALDGRRPDLSGEAPPHLIPLISDNWSNHFQWRGDGPFPESDRTRLREWVRQAHARNRKIRFWAAPDQRAGWEELRAAGVDYINTDDLDGLRDFLAPDAAARPVIQDTPALNVPE